jgi:hypothetical protein
MDSYLAEDQPFLHTQESGIRKVTRRRRRRRRREEEGKGKNGCFTPTHTEAY